MASLAEVDWVVEAVVENLEIKKRVLREIVDGYARDAGVRRLPLQQKVGAGVTLEEFDRGFFKYVGEWVDANGYQPALAEDVIPGLELDTESDPDLPAGSVTTISTSSGLPTADVIVPLMTPEVGSMATPSGRPLAS